MSEQQAQFSIEKLYVQDISLEVPNAPQIYLEREAPEIELQLQTGSKALEDGLYESRLTVTVTAKRGDVSYFLVEVVQAGLFQIRNVPQENLGPILGVGCPNILFPYAREVVSDAVNRAGFPPVILAPVNFEALFLQRQEELAQAEQAAAAAAVSTATPIQ
jgi:preprotein translocase subunit SecB